MCSSQRTTTIPIWFINPRRKYRTKGQVKRARLERSRAAKKAANSRRGKAQYRRVISALKAKTPRGAKYDRDTGDWAEDDRKALARIRARMAYKSNPRRGKAQYRRVISALKAKTPRGAKYDRDTGDWAEDDRKALARIRARMAYKSNPRRKKARKNPRKWTSLRKRYAELEAQRLYKNPRKRRKSARKRQRKQSMSRRKLYGAAAKAHARRLAKAKRRARGKRSRQNPGGISVTKKGQAAIKRRYKQMLKRRGVTGRSADDLYGHALMRAGAKKGRKAAAKRAAATRKKNKRRGATKAARKRAAKKAAATRARKKAVRVRAGKKAARTRKRKGGSKMARRKGKFRKLKARARLKRYGRGVRSLVRARASIKYGRKHGSGFAKRYIKLFKMRTNPMGAVKDMLKAAVPVVLGVVAARAVSVGLSHVPGLDGVLAKVPVVDPGVVRAVAAAGALYAVTRWVPPLTKYKNEALVGAGVNLLLQAISAYAPASVKGYIGAGEYQEVSGYQSEMADYEEVGNYEEVGAMEDMAGWADGLTKGVGRRSALKQLPSHSMVDEVPDFSEEGVAEGIFGGGWGVN